MVEEKRSLHIAHCLSWQRFKNYVHLLVRNDELVISSVKLWKWCYEQFHMICCHSVSSVTLTSHQVLAQRLLNWPRSSYVCVWSACLAVTAILNHHANSERLSVVDAHPVINLKSCVQIKVCPVVCQLLLKQLRQVRAHTHTRTPNDAFYCTHSFNDY